MSGTTAVLMSSGEGSGPGLNASDARGFVGSWPQVLRIKIQGPSLGWTRRRASSRDERYLYGARKLSHRIESRHSPSRQRQSVSASVSHDDLGWQSRSVSGALEGSPRRKPPYWKSSLSDWPVESKARCWRKGIVGINPMRCLVTLCLVSPNSPSDNMPHRVKQDPPLIGRPLSRPVVLCLGHRLACYSCVVRCAFEPVPEPTGRIWCSMA
ncbi:hypothetical protein LIA77_11544 [Sarocladium implicatum]|nr:hypothetical protein LIA77_11544 [Sarocladium implicatum]